MMAPILIGYVLIAFAVAGALVRWWVEPSDDSILAGAAGIVLGMLWPIVVPAALVCLLGWLLVRLVGRDE